MTFQITLPKLPSWRRYRMIFNQYSGRSVLRVLEYEKISKLRFEGKILDVGGGENASYCHWFERNEYHSINIDSKIKPTWVIEENGVFPIDDASYETAFCFNTLEHIYDAKAVINEINRVLKDNGKLILTVPFMYPIHAHPDDFFRATPSWWVKTLNDSGFDTIDIYPLVWGPVSTGSSVSGIFGPFKNFRFHLNLIADIVYAKMRFRNSEAYNGEAGKSICDSALGYFIEAKKNACT